MSDFKPPSKQAENLGIYSVQSRLFDWKLGPSFWKWKHYLSTRKICYYVGTWGITVFVLKVFNEFLKINYGLYLIYPHTWFLHELRFFMPYNELNLFLHVSHSIKWCILNLNFFCFFFRKRTTKNRSNKRDQSCLVLVSTHFYIYFNYFWSLKRNHRFKDFAICHVNDWCFIYWFFKRI